MLHSTFVPAIQAPLRTKSNTKVLPMPAERQASYDDDDGDLSEEELLLTAPFVYGFSLEKKIWGKLSD